MENIEKILNKYQVTIYFEMDEEALKALPAHRAYINDLIDKNIIEYYTVSFETKRVWIIINAANKQQAEDYLFGSPLIKYWKYEIDELFLYDGQAYRLPSLQFN
jgi:hypothetical protein